MMFSLVSLEFFICNFNSSSAISLFISENSSNIFVLSLKVKSSSSRILSLSSFLIFNISTTVSFSFIKRWILSLNLLFSFFPDSSACTSLSCNSFLKMSNLAVAAANICELKSNNPLFLRISLISILLELDSSFSINFLVVS